MELLFNMFCRLRRGGLPGPFFRYSFKVAVEQFIKKLLDEVFITNIHEERA